MAHQENPKTAKTLPNFHSSLKRKYVKLGYHYVISNAIYIFLIPLITMVCSSAIITNKEFSNYHHMWDLKIPTVVTCSSILVLLATVYIMRRPNKIYLVDFACYKPHPRLKMTKRELMDRIVRYGTFTQANIDLQRKILERSGLGEETYCPGAVVQVPHVFNMNMARNEAKMLIFGAIDDLLAKTGLMAKDIGILIVNCSLFNTLPSLSAMVVNHYKLRANIISYSLGGMGCSAGLISIDLAKNLLKVHPDCYALIVSTESCTLNIYCGNEPSMLLTNCLFRIGASAVLLSNKPSDRSRSKYQLIHVVRTHKGADDRGYKCAFQKDDEANDRGVALSKEIMAVAGEALKANIMTLGPLVLPFSEQLLLLASLVSKKVFRVVKMKPYIPDFKLAFEHFCIHAGGRAVLDEIEKNLELPQRQMEASRMTLYRFGNTSSSSVWYELAYIEAKGRIKKGDRTWQIGFGSGFKCNSVVWHAIRTVNPARGKNPWMDEIHKYPVNVPRFSVIDMTIDV